MLIGETVFTILVLCLKNYVLNSIGGILKEEINKDKIGLTHIARELNVSVSTVSRALNNHPRISRKTKEKVRQAAARLGYFPGIPELMAPEKTDAVAVLAPSIDSCVNRRIINGITDVMEENGYQVMVVNMQGDDARESAFFKTFQKYGISGIIHINANRLLPENFYSNIQKNAIPLVALFDSENNLKVSRIIPDMYQGVSRIVSYRKTNNVSNVTLVMENKNDPMDSQLLSSFKMVFDNFEISEKNLQTLFWEKNPVQLSKDLDVLIENRKTACALIVKGMDVAMEVSMIARKKGLSVPDDFMLIAVGSDCSLHHLTAGISFLKLPAAEMGKEAAKLLLSQLSGKEPSNNTIVLPVDFILKQSAIRIKG